MFTDYHGSCHCGRVRFAFRCEEITTGARCNCSLCVRRAAVLSSRYIPARDFTPHADARDLEVYLWNERVLNNYRCRSCGIFVYIGDGADNRDGYRVNLGCVAELDILALDVRIIDGRSVPMVSGTGHGS
jgi:hypothetical protein